MESILAALEGAGLSAVDVDMGFHAITMRVQGFTLQRLTFDLDGTVEDAATRFLGEVPANEYPYLIGHVHYHLRGSSQPGAFAFVLDLILDNLERASHAAS
jgi:hypothetical protein